MSILPFDIKGRCWACGARCQTDEHHIFQGANRAEADRRGLTVNLCRICHKRVHESPKEFEKTYHLKSMAQTAAMLRYNLSIDQWRELFRKDYR